MIILLGNAEPLESGVSAGITTIDAPAALTADEVFTAVTADTGIWKAHSSAAPLWVQCQEDVALAQRIAAYFNCPVATGEMT